VGKRCCIERNRREHRENIELMSVDFVKELLKCFFSFFELTSQC
jgi:hypothetical protein